MNSGLFTVGENSPKNLMQMRDGTMGASQSSGFHPFLKDLNGTGKNSETFKL